MMVHSHVMTVAHDRHPSSASVIMNFLHSSPCTLPLDRPIPIGHIMRPSQADDYERMDEIPATQVPPANRLLIPVAARRLPLRARTCPSQSLEHSPAGTLFILSSGPRIMSFKRSFTYVVHRNWHPRVTHTHHTTHMHTDPPAPLNHNSANTREVGFEAEENQTTSAAPSNPQAAIPLIRTCNSSCSGPETCFS